MDTRYREFFEHLRGLLLAGAIGYDQAKQQAESVLDEMNDKGREIAKKHGKKFRPFTFTSMMR